MFQRLMEGCEHSLSNLSQMLLFNVPCKTSSSLHEEPGREPSHSFKPAINRFSEKSQLTRGVGLKLSSRLKISDHCGVLKVFILGFFLMQQSLC